MDAGSAVLSGVAIVISLAAWWEARRQRMIAEGAKKAAERSAEEAARLTQIESGRRVDEREERHEQLAPEHPGTIVSTLHRDKVRGGSGIFGTITVQRDYRVKAEAWTGSATTPVAGLDLLLHANQPYRFYIEDAPESREKPRTQEIRFRFWPPVAGVDSANPWTCPCGRPTGETGEGAGHWEMRVPLEPPQRAMVSWI